MKSVNLIMEDLLRRLFHQLFLIILLFLLASCSLFSQKSRKTGGVPGIINRYIAESKDESKSVSRNSGLDLLEKEEVVDEEVADAEEEEKEKELTTISLERDPMVDKWVKYFSEKDKERFQRMLQRGARYKGVVEDILAENGLPRELYYLALIESGYVTHAKSHASAVGVWQFIKPTAKSYGLEVSWGLDERKDPIRATEAAAKYLRRLYNAFQSWELALAAYNCGEYRVLGAVMKAGSRDFDVLAKKKLLPRETRNYVPKFKASILVGENAEDHGFEEIKTIKTPALELVEVPGGVSFSTISRFVNVKPDELESYNPHLTARMTPASYDTYEIWVPGSVKNSVAGKTGTFAKYRVKSKPRERSYAGVSYKVQRGDNLSALARKFGISIAHLKSINNLKRNTIYPGQTLRTSTRSYKPDQRLTHKVKRGETLGKIARTYGMSIAGLKRINGIKGSRIYSGQRLVVDSSEKTYKVRRGDNLSNIARKFGMTVARLKSMNGMSNSKIMIGQVIRVN